MADLATLTARLEALQDTRASGVLTLDYDGRRVTYRSDPELAAAIADLERRIGALRGTRVTDVHIHSTKGL